MRMRRSYAGRPAGHRRRRPASRSAGGRRGAGWRGPSVPDPRRSSRLRPRAPSAPPRGAARRVPAALGDQRQLHRRERLELAHDPVAAAVRARAARAAPDRVLDDPQRELELQRLDRRVQRVRHRDVHAGRAVGVRARALAAAERLVVREGVGAEREVVHRALAERAAERAEDEVGDAARGLDVAGDDGGGRLGVQQRAARRDHRHRPQRARVGRDVGVGEHAHGEEAGRDRDGERAVEVAVVLRRAPAEVERQLVAGDRRGQAQLEVALERLEHVGGRARAVGQRGEARPRAPLGVGQDVGPRPPAAPRPRCGRRAPQARRRRRGWRRAGRAGRRAAARAGASARRAPRSARRSAPTAGSRRPRRRASSSRRASSPASGRRRRRGARGWRRSPAARRPRRTPA